MESAAEGEIYPPGVEVPHLDRMPDISMLNRVLVHAKGYLHHIPFAKDLLAAAYCAVDGKTPAKVRLILGGALAYFILPIDFVPDFIVGLGFTDDAAVLATAIRSVMKHMTPEHRAQAEDTLDRWAREAHRVDAKTRHA